MVKCERSGLELRLALLYRALREIEDLYLARAALLESQAHRVVTYRRRWGAGAYLVAVMIWAALLSALALAAFVQIMMTICEGTLEGIGAYGAWPALTLLMVPLLLAPAMAKITLGVHNAHVNAVNAKRNAINVAVAAQIDAELAPQLDFLDAEAASAYHRYLRIGSDWVDAGYRSAVEVGELWRIVHGHYPSTITLTEAISSHADREQALGKPNSAGSRRARGLRAARVELTSCQLEWARRSADAHPTKPPRLRAPSSPPPPAGLNVRIRHAELSDRRSVHVSR